MTCQTSSNKSLIYQHDTDTGHGVAFTTTVAGNMSMTVRQEHQTVEDVAQNRRDVEQHLGIFPGSSCFVSQTHSATVRTANTSGWAHQDTLGEGDAIISATGNEPIAILVADCLPVAFTTDYGPTAIAHAGRVGLLDGVLENTVTQLRDLDPLETGTITATIGPGICGACYEVPEALRDEAAKQHPDIAAATSWGTPSLDLPAAAETILKHAGVHVHRIHECTYTNTQLYSHRRQPGVGRIAGFVWKSSE